MRLELRDVWMSFSPEGQHIDVLKGIDLVFRSGDRVAVVGPSGSGKTTLLSIVGLLATPTSGSVSVDGHTVRSSARLRALLIGWVFQTTNILPHRSARDNVAVALTAVGYSHSVARDLAGPALESVGLAALAESKASLLSGGERQRLCIARAVVKRPRIVLADEPTGHLDKDTTAATLDALMSGLPPESILLVATHDSAVAERADRIIALDRGMLVG